MVIHFGIEIPLARQHLIPFAFGDEKIRIIHGQVPDHPLETVAPVTVDYEQFVYTAAHQCPDYVRQDGELGGLGCVQAERQGCLPRVLRTERHCRKYGSLYTLLPGRFRCQKRYLPG